MGNNKKTKCAKTFFVLSCENIERKNWDLKHFVCWYFRIFFSRFMIFTVFAFCQFLLPFLCLRIFTLFLYLTFPCWPTFKYWGFFTLLVFENIRLQGHSGQIRTVRYGGTFEIYIISNALYFMVFVFIPIGYDPHMN